MPFCDLHTHTVFSFDSQTMPYDLCALVKSLGMFGVAMTEHYDFYADNSYIYYDLFAAEREASIARLRGLYGDHLKIWKGIELGQPHYNMKSYHKLMDHNSFDLVIGSIHDLPPKKNIYQYPYRTQKDCDEVFEIYFAEMSKMLAQCDIDILAHLDYPVRVMGGVFEHTPELERYASLIRPILQTCADRGIALEVNTAGMDKWQKRPGPGVWVLEAFRKYGGERITMGSDAHRLYHTARGFVRAAEMIRQAGFDRLVYFENRKAQFYPLGR